MKYTGILLAAGLFSVSSMTFAHGHGACSETVLHDHMMSIRGELRSLSQDVKADDFSGANEHVEELISLFSQSKSEQPYLFHEQNLSGSDLSKAQASYEQMMDDVIGKLQMIQTNIENGDTASIAASVREIGSYRKKGHRQFKADC